MDQQTYIVTFDGVSPADAQRYAEELRNTLLDAIPDITVYRKRESPLTQDFGATLVIEFLGAPVVLAVVKAVGDWLTLRHRASLTLKTADGELTVQNITSGNAAELAQDWTEYLFKKQRKTHS